MSPDIVDSEKVRSALIDAIADVRCAERGSIEQEILSNGGDLTVDSLEGVAAICSLESKLGRPLAGPDDLEPEQFTSLSALVALVLRHLSDA